MAPEADRFAVAKTALARIPHGVAIIGAASGEERSCATGTCMYVSFVPPLVAIAEHPGSRTAKLIEASGEFSVSLLHSSQQDWAEAAGHPGDGRDKFAALKIRTVDAPEGLHAPGVHGSLAVLWCTVESSRAAGDHQLIVGEVKHHVIADGKIDALLRFKRRYFHIGHWTSDEAPEGYPT